MNRRQRIGVMLFAFILFFNSTRTNLIMGLYSLNNEVFVELFCENKDKPAMKCNGNCELSKMMQQNPADTEPPVLLDFFQRELQFCSNEFELETPVNQFYESKEKSHFLYLNNYSFELLGIKDRPPITA